MNQIERQIKTIMGFMVRLLIFVPLLPLAFVVWITDEELSIKEMLKTFFED